MVTAPVQDTRAVIELDAVGNDAGSAESGHVAVAVKFER